MKRNVVLLGKGTLAIRIANWFLNHSDYQLRMIVPVIPEPAWTESLCRWADSKLVPLIRSGHYKDIPDVQSETWRGDLVISVFYDKIIKPWFIDKCTRIINLHNGPLPRYRGVAPINWGRLRFCITLTPRRETCEFPASVTTGRPIHRACSVIVCPVKGKLSSAMSIS